MSTENLADIIGMEVCALRESLNSRQYINTSTLSRICRGLQCNIEDVIEWREGDQEISKEKDFSKLSVNWDLLTEIVSKKSMSLHSISLSMKRAGNYLQMKKGRNSGLHPSDVETIAAVLGVEKEKFLSAEPMENDND